MVRNIANALQSSRASFQLIYSLLVMIWAAYIVTSPIYLFESGKPQIADFIMASGIGLFVMYSFAMLPFRHDAHIHQAFIFGAIFVAYTFITNMIYYFFFGDTRLLYSSFYYVYNFMVFLLTAKVFDKYSKRIVPFAILALVISVVLEMYFVGILNMIRGSRSIGSFNNPNQLGYWAILVMCCIVVLRRDKPLRMQDFALVMIPCVFFIIQSLSKAALIVSALLFFVALFKNLFKNTLSLFVLFICLIGLVYVAAQPTVFDQIVQTNTVEKIVLRLGTIGAEGDDTAEARGYYRIIMYPQYLIAGAGEGAFYRFGASKEIHSSIGTLLFSYGVIGSLFFALFLYHIFRHTHNFAKFLLLGVLLYGITHQGLRFTMFWVFLGLVYSMAKKQKKQPVQSEADDIYLRKMPTS